MYQSQLEEKILRREDISPGDKIVPPFNAYSPPGDVESDTVFYVNYGLEEDFHWLTEVKKYNLTGAIVIARYGKVFRANKVSPIISYGREVGEVECKHVCWVCMFSVASVYVCVSDIIGL